MKAMSSFINELLLWAMYIMYPVISVTVLAACVWVLLTTRQRHKTIVFVLAIPAMFMLLLIAGRMIYMEQ
jgi:membrane-anchored protein YejM (alkaline phosphatase superfamily)